MSLQLLWYQTNKEVKCSPCALAMLEKLEFFPPPQSIRAGQYFHWHDRHPVFRIYLLDPFPLSSP